MVKRNIILGLSVVIISMLNLKCDDDNPVICEYVACTMEYRTVSVSLKHTADNTPYLLTDFKVLRVSDNADITPAGDSYAMQNGYYPVATDGKKELFRFKNVEVDFYGYLNNNLVVQRRFTITSDCCHISLVEGETTITL
jgi:hypothetical protein